MSAIIILVIIATLAQVILCHFSLWWIIAVICRVAFCMRVIGALFKVRSLAIGEGVAVALMVVYNMVVHKGALPWGRMGIFLLISLIVLGLELLDTYMYVYDVEDYEEE